MMYIHNIYNKNLKLSNMNFDRYKLFKDQMIYFYFNNNSYKYNSSIPLN